MAYVLNSTLSDEFANSYTDLSYADFFWENHYLSTKSDAWAALTDEQKTSALLTACRSLEQIRFTEPRNFRLEYKAREWYDRRTGLAQSYELDKQFRKYLYYQALQFPRQVDVNSTTGATYIPEAILMAQCEQALYEVTFDDSIIASQLQGLGREGVTLGTLKTSQTFTGLGVNIAPSALSYIRPFIIKLSTKVGRA